MIKRFGKDAASEDILKTLMADGAVIVENQVSHNLVDKVTTELRPHFDEVGDKFQNDFNGYSTLRVAGVLACSRTAADLLAHDRVMDMADGVLKPNCSSYRIGSSVAIEIHPAEADQVLHRDDEIYPVRLPFEMQISAMWALTDFTEENGATRVVPGSHDMREIDTITDDQVTQAAMPKGSVLFYLGSSVHSGGSNRSDAPRIGLVTTYSLGWLRQEENAYLTIPKEVIDTYPDHIRRLVGYQGHAPSLGLYPGDPDGLWYDA
ncbi:phytanoyl-CoA dioxygenase family protein [Pseudemcibacter aquimaris]|uniref:phytanoyl-CoA dioxygenase family protein n=1 Tax=Pseudemcibacter aquimaris TaxID=2857064 RepID=UPI002012FFDE|nr:phytanoyl-CoA dioxygenase family protein [Pseudemcibacter aquimaris]MCC3861028.1 phytanoyl-CoA dioxygenase family protein [Pseudemcibacter aquimaris]WDU59846.1 phytanoyl-CoA dioxygenase family protein [Pseudemcibacter aquimaris]